MNIFPDYCNTIYLIIVFIEDRTGQSLNDAALGKQSQQDVQETGEVNFVSVGTTRDKQLSASSEVMESSKDKHDYLKEAYLFLPETNIEDEDSLLGNIPEQPHRSIHQVTVMELSKGMNLENIAGSSQKSISPLSVSQRVCEEQRPHLASHPKADDKVGDATTNMDEAILSNSSLQYEPGHTEDISESEHKESR